MIGSGVTSIEYGAFEGCDGLTSVYYNGTLGDWIAISISADNFKLTSATMFYYSETQPTESGNYWRYFDGVPTAW